jgi:hypothetical protein
MNERPTPFAIFGCPHCPFENDDAVDWLVGQLEDLSPRPRKLICAGDLFESASASVWPNEYEHTLEDEYEHGAKLLRRIREMVPYRCEYIWLLGNHDDNLQVPDPRRVKKQMRGLLHWNVHHEFKKEFLKWDQIPYVKSPNGCLEVGQVAVIHGFDSSLNSDELESLQFQYMLGGLPWRLVVRAHTHRPVEVTQCLRTRQVPLACHYANVGTLGPLQPQYMQRKSAILWGPGLVVGEAVEGYDPLGGRQWTAELRTP